MGSFDLTISAEDLATLQNVPQQIATLATNAQQALAAVRSGADSGNPVGALLSGLQTCLLYTSPSPRDRTRSRMPSSA